MRLIKRRDGPQPRLAWLEVFLDQVFGTIASILASLVMIGGQMAFNGARHYLRFALVTIAACVLAIPVVGWGTLPAAGVALYLLLTFFNELERRDLRESQKRIRPTKPRRIT